jgi:hypothetical protein
LHTDHPVLAIDLHPSKLSLLAGGGDARLSRVMLQNEDKDIIYMKDEEYLSLPTTGDTLT